MAESAHIDVEGETPVNPYSLLEAVNRSSDTAHTAWLIFLAVMAYLMIAVAGVSHKDLLLEKAVQLPILGVPIPQVQFFQFAPVFLLLFHLGLIAQLVLLARKTLEFDISVRQLEPTSRRTHPLRLELHNFFFVQGVAGPHRSAVMSFFLHSMSWLTLAILPVVLLLFIQLSFLPYHDPVITWTHRITLLLDIGVLTLIGVFLTRAETNFFQAFWRTSIKHPFSFVITSAVLTFVAFFSFVVATIPGETLDVSVRKFFQMDERNKGRDGSGDYLQGFTVPFLWGSTDGTLFGFFHRNLIVTDIDLVVDRDVTPGERSISLRGRDLRYAQLDRSDLHQADMTGVNLDGASLIGTDLSNVRLNCQDENELLVGDGQAKAKCSSARDADFTGAKLAGAQMTGIDVSGAKLENANLEGAVLKFAIMEGTNFWNANLRKADLTAGVQGQGANFLVARMEGADLNGAQLQFADFSNAQLQAASFMHAHLQGAVLRDADLSASTLVRARLHGADMTGADLTGADMRLASVWMTLPPGRENLRLADFTRLQIKPLSKVDRESLDATLKDIEDNKLRVLVADGLKPIMSKTKSAAWATSDEAGRWQALATVADPANTPEFRTELTTYLERLSCKASWSQGSVAEGIARRARARDFRGDLPAIYLRLTAIDDCKPGKQVAKPLIQELAATVDARIDNNLFSAPQLQQQPQPIEEVQGAQQQ